MGSITSKNKKPKYDGNLPSKDNIEAEKTSLGQRNFEGRDDRKCNVSKSGRKLESFSSPERSTEVLFVFKRRGSMYVDEEGGVAHEFYEEVISPEPGVKPYMKRQVENLTPQGDVEYDFPRLSGDCDIIICDP